VRPTQYALHETLEITHGWTNNFETGYYLFNSYRKGEWDVVGTHIRPRIKAPDNWKLPVGLSLSLEFGYQRSDFSEDTWTLEIRPIIDKQLGRWYLAFNPTLEYSLVGQNAGTGTGFSPNVQIGVDINKKINLALEYCGSFGPITDFDPREATAPDLPRHQSEHGRGMGVQRRYRIRPDPRHRPNDSQVHPRPAL
jgi:hypothetical protein